MLLTQKIKTKQNKKEKKNNAVLKKQNEINPFNNKTQTKNFLTEIIKIIF